MSLNIDAISEVETDENIMDHIANKRAHKDKPFCLCFWRGREVKQKQPAPDALVRSWHIGSPRRD